MESAETDLAEKGEQQKQLQFKIEAEKESIEKEAEEDLKQLEATRKLREQVDQDVDAVLKKDYERTKKIVKTRIVVPVINATCQGCHMNLPPQMFIDLQRGGQLKFCPHCDRIIYWDDML
jgi:predicted  nucleic acid-binding Zn-ribbon protein